MKAKKKPAKRVNWKAQCATFEASADRRADHIEFLNRRLTELTARAERAEKQVADLMAERQKVAEMVADAQQRRAIAESAHAQTGAVYAEYSRLPEGKGSMCSTIKLPAAPTSLWQRLKGWWG